MWKCPGRALVATCVVACLAVPAHAEEPKPDAAAMERAKRLADNPLRAIIEASKIRRKAPAKAEAAPETADEGSVRRAALRTGAADVPPRGEGAAPAQPPKAPAAPRPAPSLSDAAAPVIAAAPAVPMAVSVPTEGTLHAPPPIPQSPPLQSAALAAPMTSVDTPAALPALTPAAPEPAPVPPDRAVAPAKPAPSAGAPKLLEMVEPVILPSALDEAGGINEVVVDVTIRPDGSVAQVRMVNTVPRSLQRPVVQALVQWRYEPLPAERVHRVQLVFRSN